jgi:hypothetical protein
MLHAAGDFRLDAEVLKALLEDRSYIFDVILDLLLPLDNLLAISW